jgi:hypothetical protein
MRPQEVWSAVKETAQDYRGAAIQPTPNAEHTENSAAMKDEHRPQRPQSTRIPK